MSMPSSLTTAEGQIRDVIEAWAAAIRARDVAGVLEHFHEDSVRFYLAPPLKATTPLKTNLGEWFATFDGPLGYEIRDLAVTANEALAFAHSLNHVTGTRTKGEAADLWFRETLCLTKRDGQWRIAHAHESVPFYMDGTLKAAVDLKP
ncbi:MAG: putative glyoxalase family protein [Verrucomicrobiaceae bacterium]|nr:putative glyoxalase family protein [Verrucomicrobiaceae bacterium]